MQLIQTNANKEQAEGVVGLIEHWGGEIEMGQLWIPLVYWRRLDVIAQAQLPQIRQTPWAELLANGFAEYITAAVEQGHAAGPGEKAAYLQGPALRTGDVAEGEKILRGRLPGDVSDQFMQVAQAVFNELCLGLQAEAEVVVPLRLIVQPCQV